MSKEQGTGTNLKSSMDRLASKDGMIRQKARKSLVALGKPAVSFLIKALQDSKLDQVRWEAAKALGAISDARSIPVLVEALEDCDSDVTWLAAEALITFKKAAWPLLLQRLVERGAKSDVLRQGAHHVFREQKAGGVRGVPTSLIEALDSNGDPESVPLAASDLRRRLKGKP